MACPKCGGTSCGGSPGTHFHEAAKSGLPSGYTSKPTGDPNFPDHRFATRIVNTPSGQYKTTSVYDSSGRVKEYSKGKAGGFLTGIFGLFK